MNLFNKSNSRLILLSDNSELIRVVRLFSEARGLDCEVKPEESDEFDQGHREQRQEDISSKESGEEMGKILSFKSKGAQIQTMQEVEKGQIERAIVEFKGNITGASKALNLGRATLYRKIKSFKIDLPDLRRQHKAA